MKMFGLKSVIKNVVPFPLMCVRKNYRNFSFVSDFIITLTLNLVHETWPAPLSTLFKEIEVYTQNDLYCVNEFHDL